MEIYEVAPAEGFAGSWIRMIADESQTLSLQTGVIQPSRIPAVGYWKDREGKRTFPIPDVSITQSALLVHPDLMSGLPLAEGVDYQEIELSRREFPHRVLSILNAPGAFDAERSETVRTGNLIVAVKRHVFAMDKLRGRSAFLVEELGWEIFVGPPVVDYFRQRGARGLSFRQVWPVREVRV